MAEVDSEVEDQDMYVGPVYAHSTASDRPWTKTVNVNGIDLQCKLDTGADVPIIPHSLYQKHFEHVVLQNTSLKVKGADLKTLKVLGCFDATVKCESGACVEEKIYVIKRSAFLLSRKASTSLGLVKLVFGGVQMDTEVKKAFPTLFAGLGKLSSEYDIKIVPNVKPYSVHAPRRIALTHMSKVKKELERLCELDVITPVSEPTE